MTTLRKAAEMALDALRNAEVVYMEQLNAMYALQEALAQPEQKPVAWVYNGILHEFDPSEFATSEVTPLYTAPPKREWVGLTEEERDNIINQAYDDYYARKVSDTDLEIIKNTDAKLKEKNT